MKNLLLITICLLGFSYSFANSELENKSILVESKIIEENSKDSLEVEVMDCGLLADTVVKILNNQGFPTSGTAVIGNLIEGICERIFN